LALVFHRAQLARGLVKSQSRVFSEHESTTISTAPVSWSEARLLVVALCMQNQTAIRPSKRRNKAVPNLHRENAAAANLIV